MKVAARLGGRVSRLVLLETNPFYLLAQTGRTDAFAEVIALRICVKEFGARGEWTAAAEKFADSSRISFEWDAVMSEATSAEQWATDLPDATLMNRPCHREGLI